MRQWIYAGLVVAGVYFGSDWGIPGVCVGVGLAVFGNFLMMTQLAQRILNLRFRALLGVHLVQLRSSAIICLPVWLVVELCRHQGYSDFVVLLVGCGTAASVVAVFWFLFRRFLGELGEWLNDLIVVRLNSLRQRKG